MDVRQDGDDFRNIRPTTVRSSADAAKIVLRIYDQYGCPLRQKDLVESDGNSTIKKHLRHVSPLCNPLLVEDSMLDRLPIKVDPFSRRGAFN